MRNFLRTFSILLTSLLGTILQTHAGDPAFELNDPMPRELPPIHYLGTGQAIHGSPEHIRVKVPVYLPVHSDLVSFELSLSQEQKFENIDRSVYEQEMRWARSIFRTRSAGGGGNATSFLIDRSVVLTNAHVLSLPRAEPGKPYPFQAQTVSCRKFAIEFQGEWIPCVRVLYCHAPYDPMRDFCVVQIATTHQGKQVGDIVPPFQTETLTKQPLGTPYLMIGNVDSNGLQASWGRLRGSRFYTYASQPREKWSKRPTIHTFNDMISSGGASGSPIINPRTGKVIALNYGRYFNGRTNPPYVFKDAYVTALPIELVKAELRYLLAPSLQIPMSLFLAPETAIIQEWIKKQPQREN